MAVEAGNRMRAGSRLRSCLIASTVLAGSATFQASVAYASPTADRAPLPLQPSAVFDDAALASQTEFDIPPGDLAPALTRWSEISRIQILAPTEDMRGIRSEGLTGAYPPERALTALLEGTGLTYRYADPRTITIINPRYVQLGAPAVPPGGVLLEELSVEGRREAAAAAAGLPPPTGTVGQPPAPYAGGQVASGGRIGFLGNRNVFDTPFTQNNFTSQLIRDQQAASVADVLANDAGVRTTAPPFGVGELFIIRGFATGENDIAFDGLYGLAGVRRPALEGVERVEVLRGPGSLLFGFPPSGTPAGIINLVPKRAPELPLTRVTAEYFSNSNVGGKFDVARRFGDDNAFGVRLNGAYRDGGTPIDRQEFRNGVFTAGLDFRGDRFRASVDLGYQSFNVRAPSVNFGILSGVAVPRAPDLTKNIQQPWSYTSSELMYGLARAEYDIAPDWTLFGAVGASRDSEKFLYSNPTITNSAGNVSIANFAFPLVYETVTSEAGIRGIFDTGPVHHNLTVAANRYDQQISSAFGFFPSAETTNIDFPGRLTRPDVGDTFTRARDRSDSTLTGVTVGDTLSILDDRIQLIVGGRFQRAETASLSPAGEGTSYGKNAATPLVGFVVKPWQPLSMYVSYAEGFGFGPTPPSGAFNRTQVFPPTISTQIETGAKVNFGAFGATLAFFEIKQPSGILNPSGFFGLNGEQRNRGIDFNVFGQPIEGVRVLGGFSAIDGRLTKTERGLFDGNVVPGVPNFQLNLGGEIDLPPWMLPDLTLTGRVLYTTAQYVDQANTQKIPDWTRLDLGVRYRFDVNGTPLVARFNVENVTGANYWASSFNGNLTIGSPRVFRFALSADL